jgi:hypothetical protein
MQIKGCTVTDNQEKISRTVGVCLSVSEVWKLALQPSSWPADTSEHLLTCQGCRGRLTRALAAVQTRESAERKLAGALLLLAGAARCCARQPFALPRPADRFDSGPTQEDGVVVFDFDDPNLQATLSAIEDGGGLLRIEHRKLEVGDLILALVRDTGGTVVWARFVMLRRGFRHAIGHVRIAAWELEKPRYQLFIDPVPLVPAEAAGLLRDSFFQACLDAPESIEMWRTWAREMLERDSSPQAVRLVLEQVRDADLLCS